MSCSRKIEVPGRGGEGVEEGEEVDNVDFDLFRFARLFLMMSLKYLKSWPTFSALKK